MRVLRTARMARLVRFMPELMILVKGMMVAFRSVQGPQHSDCIQSALPKKELVA